MTGQQPMYLPQDMYDLLMSLPDGTDLSEFFDIKFSEPGWDLKVTKGPAGAAPGADGDV